MASLLSEFLPSDNSSLFLPLSGDMEAKNTSYIGSVADFFLNTSFESESNKTVYADNLYNVTPGLVVLLSILYGSISVISVTGNFLVILVILKNKSMHTVTNFFIANLSVADVMIGILSIPFQFQAALLQRWDLPHFLCPAAPFVKELSVNVSIITLTIIGIDRYRAVIYPLKPRCTSKTAKLVMLVVWAFSLGSSIPPAVVFKVIYVPDGVLLGAEKPFCSPQFPEVKWADLGKLYRLYVVIVQYFFPLLIISFAYFRIMHKIWLTKAPGSAMDSRDAIMNKNKKKVIKMLIIVVVLFAFCWLPLQTYNLLSEIFPSINEYRYINIIWFCSNWLAMSNSCYNPFIYGLLNEKFKHGFRVLFIKCPCVSKDRKDLKAFKDTMREHSDSTPRGARRSLTTALSHDHDTRIQMNNGRMKRYVRVSGLDGHSTISTAI